ncbi:MAG: ABC transporter ATP-binding protein [Vulcanimicrobiaceae bacterium]
MIQARELRVRAGTRTLLEGVNFDVREREFVAVLGPNGAGKTTLLRAIAGTGDFAGGTLRVGGRPIESLGANERARTIAYMASDDAFAENMCVRDVVAMGRYSFHHWWQWHEEPRDREAVDAALRAVGMELFADRAFPTLSTGERQRIWLALGLAQEAPLLLLDEPTSHLDIRVGHEILELLRHRVAAGKTVVCALHDLNEAAAYADRIMLLGCGRMLAFDPPELLLRSPLLEDAYGIPMEAVAAPSGILRVFPRVTNRRSRCSS